MQKLEYGKTEHAFMGYSKSIYTSTGKRIGNLTKHIHPQHTTKSNMITLTRHIFYTRDKEALNILQKEDKQIRPLSKSKIDKILKRGESK